MRNVRDYLYDMKNIEVLGYDCDGEEIFEFMVLRAHFSALIDNWDEQPNVDPRFYCLVRSSKGKVFAVSVYDDYNTDYIRRYENLNELDVVPTSVKSVADMENYEIAINGITDDVWYYDRDRNSLRKELDGILKQQEGFARNFKKNNL